MHLLLTVLRTRVSKIGIKFYKNDKFDVRIKSESSSVIFYASVE